MSTNIIRGIASCVLLVLASCNKYESTNTITMSDAIEVSFDNIATDINLIPLKADFPLDEADQIQMYGDESFVFSYNNSIIYYFKNGQYVSTLNSKGRGYGEYSGICRFTYSPENHILYILTGNDKNVLWYDVPSMKFQGQTELDDYPDFIKLINKDTLLINQENKLCMVDIFTGESTEICSVSKVANTHLGYSIDSFSSDNNILSLCDEHNIIYVLENGKLKQLDEISFGDDGFPLKYTEFYNNPKEDDINFMIEAKTFQFTEHYLDGIWRARLLDGGYEFWYFNKNAPEGDKDFYRLYRNVNGKITNLKGFCIPGIKDQIYPKGNENGSYYQVLSGPSEALADPDEEPSELAKRIFKAVDSQPDFNPVIMTWKM